MICDQVGDPTQVDPDPTCPLNHSYDRPTDRRILRPCPALVSLIIFVNVALFAFLLTRPLDACATVHVVLVYNVRNTLEFESDGD